MLHIKDGGDWIGYLHLSIHYEHNIAYYSCMTWWLNTNSFQHSHESQRADLAYLAANQHMLYSLHSTFSIEAFRSLCLTTMENSSPYSLGTTRFDHGKNATFCSTHIGSPTPSSGNSPNPNIYSNSQGTWYNTLLIAFHLNISQKSKSPWHPIQKRLQSCQSVYWSPPQLYFTDLATLN